MCRRAYFYSMEYVLLYAIIAGAFGGFIREIYANKGIFALPCMTEKGLALGGILSIILGAAAGVLSITLYDLSVPYWFVGAFSHGIVGTDIVANVIGATRPS